MTPLVSRLEAEHKVDELRRRALDGSHYATALLLPVGLTFMMRGKTFIGLWMGKDYAQVSGELLWILTIGMLITAGPASMWAVSFGLSKHKALVPAYLCVSAANLGLSIFLVRRIGLVGVAWGTAIPELVVSLFFWPAYVWKILKIPVPDFLAHVWMRPLFAMVPFGLCTYLMERWWIAANLLVFFIQVGLATLLAGLGFWFMCLSTDQREASFGAFRQRLGAGFR